MGAIVVLAVLGGFITPVQGLIFYIPVYIFVTVLTCIGYAVRDK